MMSAQNVTIFQVNAIYTAKTSSGDMQTKVNAVNPAFTNSYIAKPNKRKSNNALPPVSCVYVVKFFVIYFA